MIAGVSQIEGRRLAISLDGSAVLVSQVQILLDAETDLYFDQGIFLILAAHQEGFILNANNFCQLLLGDDRVSRTSIIDNSARLGDIEFVQFMRLQLVEIDACLEIALLDLRIGGSDVICRVMDLQDVSVVFSVSVVFVFPKPVLCLSGVGLSRPVVAHAFI